jgi:F-type H+-transporting ATPase subunit b
MTLDATFWVAISFVIFVLFLAYKKIPQMVIKNLDDQIENIKKKIQEAENLKAQSEELLNNYQKQIDSSKKEYDDILNRANEMSKIEMDSLKEKMENILKNKEKNILEKINQSKNEALHQVKKVATVVAIESVKKILSEDLDQSKRESNNLHSLKSSIDQLKKIN